MVVSQTPMRISLTGGGTDIPAYHEEIGRTGHVISFAIDKFVHVCVNKKFDNWVRVSYSQTENVRSWYEVKHPIVRECLDLMGFHNGIEIASVSDIPGAGTGLGSSSSFCVGLLNALVAHKEEEASADALAQMACFIEVDKLKSPIGYQDQTIAAYGGARSIRFNSGVHVDSLSLPDGRLKELNQHLLMLYTGVTRSANEILEEQCKESPNKLHILDQMSALSQDLKQVLEHGLITDVGEILDNNWELKKQLATGISNERIDNWYEFAKRNGATGGKILGAGGGGFLLLFAPPDSHYMLAQRLGLRKVDFEFCEHGSRIVFDNGRTSKVSV